MTADALSRTVETLAGLGDRPLPDALAQVEAIVTTLPSCSAPERLEAIAGALPARVGPLAPELALALANLALTLAHHRPRLPGDLDALSPALRVAWLRVELCIADDPVRLAAIDDALLLRTLGDWPDALLDAGAPELLLDRMARADDPRLRATALERLTAALEHLAITPSYADALRVLLAGDDDPSLRRAALEGMRERFSDRLSPVNEAALRARIAVGLADPALSRVCAQLAAELGERELLVELVFDEHRDPSLRATALRWLGELVRDEDLDAVLELALSDPLAFGGPVAEVILAAHCRGVFVRDAQLPAMLAAFDSHHGWTGEQLVRVTYIARTALLATLAELPADDRRWIRRAAILAASVDTDAHTLINKQLRTTTDPRIAAALIDAAGRSPDFCDEDALLAWLPRLPVPAIAVLRVKGSDRCVEALRELVTDRRTATELRELAMPTLWALSRDRRTLLRELSQRIGPNAAGLLDASRLSARDDTAAQILVELGESGEVEPLRALTLLCEAGKPELLPAITRLFRALFTEYVGAALAGDFTIKRLRMPELEQLIHRYGRHLIADGRSVRRWIEDRPDTGDALVLDLAIEWLREDPPAAICVALLETIARKHPTGAALRRIERYWRHGDVEIRRAALEAILAGETDARGLELSIGRLADVAEAKIVRQALIGIRTLEARWAEALVIAALARPQMLIKREAADTLAVIGSSRCVPTLVGWLATHDNHGFRTDLRRALLAVTKHHALAVLVDALANTDDRRERELLSEAIAGLLTLRAAVRLARSAHPAHVELVERALAGDVALADASVESLAVALHRARLRTVTQQPDIGRRLRLEGFSPPLALELLAQPDHGDDPRVIALVRAELVQWLSWLGRDEGPEDDARIAATELVLAASESGHREHFDALLGLVEQRSATLDPAVVFEFVERCLTDPGPVAQRARALAVIRSLPPAATIGGPRRYALLGKLGALRDRDDLERCLSDCRSGPSLARDSERLLTVALAIPPTQPDEARRLDPDTVARLEQLREDAKRWYRMDSHEAEQWLSEQLRTRPLELPALAPWPWPRYAGEPEPTRSRSRGELDSALALLEDPSRDRAARERAAEWILATPETRTMADSWARVLAIYLADAIDLSDAALTELAASLDEWPAGPWSRARPLFVRLDLQQRRRFLPAWIRAWDHAEPDADELLRALGQELLVPVVRARAEAGDYVMLRLLHRSGRSIALRELVELGLAVRAIHRLAELGEAAGDALVDFTCDRRPRIRSAAFRALRRVVSHERRLAAAVAMLEIETRRDVIASLLATLAHARYEPGFAAILEHLSHRDNKLRDAAERALLSWGGEALPLLHRAASRARPDRRRIYATLITKLDEVGPS